MAENDGSKCFSFVELVINGVRRCFGLENVHSGAAATSDNVKPLICEDEAETIVSITEEISNATNYYPPVVADQETPSTENNDSTRPPPVAEEGFGAPPPRIQNVSKGSGPKSN